MEYLKKLKQIIEFLNSVLSNEKILFKQMKKELLDIKKEYATERKTVIKDEISEIKIDELDMVSKEDFIVCISNAGYVKKISLKAFAANPNEYPTVKEGDYLEGFYKVNNLDNILLFTNLGNYLYLPVREIAECKFKDIGNHISSIIKTSDGEKIVKTIAVNKFDDSIITAFTKNGMVKRMILKDFEVSRYIKPILMFKMKEDDELLSVSRYDGSKTVVITDNGIALRYNTSEIPIVGLRTSGVRSIKLDEGSHVVGSFVVNDNKEFVTIFTDKNTAKRVHIEDITLTSRAKKGSSIIKSPKSKTYNIIKAFNTNSKTIFGVLDGSIGYLKSSDINIMDKSSTGSIFTKKNVDNVFMVSKLIDITNQDVSEKEKDTEEVKQVVEENTEPEIKKEKEETIKEKKEVKEVKEVKEKKTSPKKEKQLTMSDFFEEFKI